MAETKLPIDYVTKDYDGFLEMMKEQIPNLTPEWTDTGDTDPGIVILQTLAYGLHVLGYYEDKSVNENILHNAETKKAILKMSKFLGYEVTKQSPSVSRVFFKKYDNYVNRRVVIPKATKVSTDPALGEQVIFETVEPLILEVGVESGEVDVIQGETVIREVVGVSTGEPEQQFLLEYPFVIEDTLEIVTEENKKDYYWTRVENMIDSLPADRHYMTSVDEEDQTIITFGDGVFGMRPPKDATVRSNYRHGGGTIGNVALGKINFIEDTLLEGIEDVENIEPATGGEDFEDLERIRTMAPKIYRTGGKAVTPQDFEDLSEKISGVARALCVETFNENNDVELYIATTDYEPATQSLLDKVKSELDKVRVMNSNLIVKSCDYFNYDVEVTVYIADNFVPAQVKEEVFQILQDYLDPANFDLGATIYLAKLIERSFFAGGVRNAVINSPTGDISCDFNELPKLHNLKVNVVGGVSYGES